LFAALALAMALLVLIVKVDSVVVDEEQLAPLEPCVTASDPLT